MATTLSAAPQCARCSAPLGVSDRRCPFCGFERAVPLSVPPPSKTDPPPSEPHSDHLFPSSRAAKGPQPAEIGLTAYNEGRREVLIQAPPRRLPSPMTIFGALSMLALIGGGAWSVYQSTRPPPPPLKPLQKTPDIPAVISSIGALAVPDADRADPTLMLGEVQRKVLPGDAEAKLVSIRIVGSLHGVVDLKKPGGSVTYLYAAGRPTGATATLVPRGQPLAGRDGRQLVLQVNGGMPQTVPLPKGAMPVPEPLCVWAAAWRTAVKSGVADTEVVDGVYAMKNDEPRWVLSVAGKPEMTREIDGKSCAIKTR